MRFYFLLWVGLGFISQLSFSQNLPRIELKKDTLGKAYFVVAPINLPAKSLQGVDYQKLFPVFTGEKAPSDPNFPAILGKYQWENASLNFFPRFPLSSGLSYYAEWDQGYFDQLTGIKNATSKKTTASFYLPSEKQSPSTIVTHVYPSTDTLPANQLKFYIHFSAPMRQGQGLKQIKVLGKNGKDIKPFLPMPEELWDQQQKRLTVFFDPGRIKRGLVPHQEFGEPLQPNQKYILVIETEFKDKKGIPLKTKFQKKFYTTQADRVRPYAKNWQIEIPQAESREALLVHFQETMDAALAKRCIQVRDSKGNPIAGNVILQKQESSWQFIPETAWKPGVYQLKIYNRLEDLAGNNLNKLFDTDVNLQQSPIDNKFADFSFRTFEIKNQK